MARTALSSRNHVLFCLIQILAFTTATSAQFGIPVGRADAQNKPVVARERVSQYCRLDYAGGRLSPEDWSKLQPLVVSPKNPDFPLINVVSRFDVDSEVSTQHGRYLVTVHYRLLGRFNMGEGYTTEVAKSIEDVQFAVEESNGEFKIADINPNYPRPSRAAMLKWLEANQAKAQDEHSKTVYGQALKELQAQSGSPFAN